MLLKKTDTLPYNLILCCLIIVGFGVRLYMAHVDPFLHLWDERFHALVARNMMDAPFKPMLRANPILPPDPFSWTYGSSLWLHKQPLFMWQMALSMKLFGTTVYAVRYPSVLMGTLMIPMVYSIVSAVTKDKLIAIITAGLFCFSNFHLELVAGMRSMDHNDLCLEFYVLASVWAWIKYEEKKQWYWLLLIGLCSGAAILTKWLIGLFVYLVWGIKILIQLKERLDIKEIGRFSCSLLACCLVFLPWQFFIMKHYPVEAAFEYEFNRRHITEAIEGHDGTVFYYLARFPQLFGEGIFLLIFPGLYLWYSSKEKATILSASLLAGVLFVFVFFSIIVKAKVISHFYFVAPFVMMLMAYFMVYILREWIPKAYLAIVILTGIFILNGKPEKIILDQSSENQERNANISNAGIYAALQSRLPKGVIVTNVPDCISFMFFNKGADAYEFLTEEHLRILEERKVPVFAFDHINDRPLPDYILHYPYLQLIHDEVKQIK